MIIAAVFVAFVVGLVLEATVLALAEHRRRVDEAAFWADLRTDALNGYGQLFDWSQEPDL